MAGPAQWRNLPVRGLLLEVGRDVRQHPADAIGQGFSAALGVEGVHRLVSEAVIGIGRCHILGRAVDQPHDHGVFHRRTGLDGHARRDGQLLDLAGCDLPRTAEALLSLMPLDTFVDAPVARMQVVGDPDRIVPIHQKMQDVVDRLEARQVSMQALQRFEFYAAAKRAFAVVRTSDAGPYGCFIFRKGVI